MKSLSTRIMVMFSVVIVMVVATISLLVQHYVVVETTKTEIKNARLQRDQAIQMMEIAWENHLYHRETLISERKNLLNDVTSVAFSIIKKARGLALNNDITEAEAKKRAMDTIRRMRFAKGAGYFWIQDLQKPIPYMLMHPVVPTLDNKLSDAEVCYTALEDGSNLNAKFVEVCENADNNEAFLPYRWPKPTDKGLSEIQPKLSFVKIFPEWGWLLGTGLYIDDIERESSKNLETIKAKIIENLSNIRIANSGYMFVFDKSYNFVAHPSLVGPNGDDHLRPDTGTSILKDLVNEYDIKGNDILEYEWDKPGQNKDEHFKKIAITSYFEPLGWYICASVYKDELKAPAQQLMSKILLASSLLLLVALFFAWRLSKSVSKPIVQLATTAKQIGAGEVNTIEIQPASMNEIETLTTCLSDMLISLNTANERLRQTQKMDAIGQLAGGIAHDFNNMLGGIMGCANMLSKKFPQDSPHQKYISIISDSATRAAALSSQLLSFSRKQELAVSKVDLHAIINDAISILSNTIDKRVLISSALEATEHIIDGEYSQLQNVFINLGINASHAMRDGGKLSFSTRIFEKQQQPDVSGLPALNSETDFIEISIIDTGCGMSPETITHIFEPFYTTKEQGEGTGLGLTSAYGTIQQHKGTILVESTVDIGSQFKIILPLAPAEEKDQTSTRNNEPELLNGTGTILVVDDEEVLRFTLENILINYGYKVLLAKNGKQAIERYKSHRSEIDAVVCDMIMPEMNGYECFLALKEFNPDIKFIIASGFTKDNSINDLKKKGLSGFIKKPFQDIEIGKLVVETLKVKKQPG